MTDPTRDPTGVPIEYSEQSRAKSAIVLGSLGLLCLPPLSAIGFWLAISEQRGIDEGARDPSNRKKATVAVGIGAVGLAIWGIVLVALLLTLSLNFAAG